MKKWAFFLLLGTTFLSYAMGNPQQGEVKSSTCAACHGPKGVSNNPQWPSLAGQHATYLLKQLQDFKKDTLRPSPIMSPLVAQLSEQDMEDLAAYYASLPRAEGKTPEKFVKRGEVIYRGGDFDKKITACIACHGPTGFGNAQARFPVLSGQQPVYTTQQLQAFKDKKRSNDLNAIMQDISARMGTEDMEAVANYVAGLH